MAADQEEQVPAYDSITITLKQSLPKPVAADVSERSIRLTTSQPVLKIGRSSKSESKGLFVAADNAYFDCSVVSRAHAEIKADFLEGVVRLADVNSLHGTFLNGDRLRSGGAHTLHPGDVVRFGAPVARGLVTFDPVECEVAIASEAANPPTVRSRSYCAPESIDDGLSDESESEGVDAEEPHQADSDLPSASPANDPADWTMMEEAEIANRDENADCPAPLEIESHGSDVPGPRDQDSEPAKEKNVPENEDCREEGRVEEEEGEVFEYEAFDDAIDESEDESEDDEDEDEEMDLDEYDEDDSEQLDEGSCVADVYGDMADLDNVIDLADDDGSNFLDQTIRQHMMNSRGHYDDVTPAFERARENAMQMPAPVPAVEADIAGDHAVWTPPFGPDGQHAAAEDASAHEVPPDEDNADTTDNADNADNTDTADKATVSTAAQAYAVNNMCHISSILNPTSPQPSYAAEPALFMDYGGLPPSPASSEDSGGHACDSTAMSVTPEALMVPTTPTSEPVRLRTDPSRLGERVSWFSVHAASKASKKRKAAQMSADGSGSSAPQAPQVAMAPATTPAPEPAVMAVSHADGPAAKRQATTVAMAKSGRSMMWAVAEKIGIAALGGAVVLGSLIYTAPAL